MKKVFHFFRKIPENRLLLAIATFISGAAAVSYFWEKIDRHLGISQNRWVLAVAAFWDDKIAHAVQNWGWVEWATFISGLAAVAYFCEKFLPYPWKGMRKMKEKLPNKKIPSLEQPEGQVPLDSPFYVERLPVDSDCYEAVSKPYALIRIKAPRQMGKTSLMTRVLDHARQQGCRTVAVYFEQADSDIFADLNLFLQWFCASVTQGLNLEDKVEAYWQGILGSKGKAIDYFHKYLLIEAEEPLVIGLDEVDLIFEHPKIATDFFALLRAWHERGKNEAIWKRLRLVIVHSQEVYIPLKINQSPFNVGFPAELPELTPDQANDLSKRHRISFPPESLRHLMKMLGGHPYLLRVALYDLARKRIKLLKIAPTEHGPYSDHLRRHLSNLRENDRLLAAMRQVITADVPVKIGEVETFKLRSLGLVKFQGEGNDVVPLCDLYRIYFKERLK